MLRLAVRWPMPALFVWIACWVVFRAATQGGAAPGLALLLGCVPAGLAAARAATRWRRLLIAAGFPLSVLVLGVAGGAAAAWWLIPLALLVLLYPVTSWSDAPLFPTPRGALAGIARAAPLPDGAAILDAGCGLGAGLLELHRHYPGARLEGQEWSWPLALSCRWRCRRVARVTRADIWADDWSRRDMVYLFQRPESMARALRKAAAELRPGAWLVSLEFPVPGLPPAARIEPVAGKPVWLYRAPLRAAPAGRGGAPATNAATSSSTGASQRSGHASEAASVA